MRTVARVAHRLFGGALIVAASGAVLATGYSHENDFRDHAEEVALAKLTPDDGQLDGAILYSSLEPTSWRP